jgi:hypothetical protein
LLASTLASEAGAGGGTVVDVVVVVVVVGGAVTRVVDEGVVRSTADFDGVALTDRTPSTFPALSGSLRECSG